MCALDCPFPRSQERVCLGSLWRGARRARGARGTVPQSRGGVPCPGRWGRREEALGPPHGRQSSQLEPARRPPGAGPGKDCLATCLRMRPSQFEPQWRVCCGPGCFRCGASGLEIHDLDTSRFPGGLSRRNPLGLEASLVWCFVFLVRLRCPRSRPPALTPPATPSPDSHCQAPTSQVRGSPTSGAGLQGALS